MTKKIVVRFATNRAQVETPDMFGSDFADPDDPGRYVTGRVEVVQDSGLPDTGWWPDASTLHVDAVTIAPAEAAEAGIVGFAKAVGARMRTFAGPAAAPSGIVLLHGFAASFADSMSRAAQVCAGYGASEVFVFSWPTRGKVTPQDYREDQNSSERSAAAVADSLTALLAFLDTDPVRARLQLVAHSMGTRALRFALQAIRQRHPELLLKPVFQHTLLVASDEDDDALADEGRMAPLLRLSRHVEVYHSGADLALAVSQLINGRPRIGLSGPRDMPALPGTVTSIDASAVGQTTGDHGETHFGHQYYRLAPRVVGDVVHVLANVRPDDIPGRLEDPSEPLSGGSFYLPYDEAAGRAVLASVAALQPQDAS